MGTESSSYSISRTSNDNPVLAALVVSGVADILISTSSCCCCCCCLFF